MYYIHRHVFLPLTGLISVAQKIECRIHCCHQCSKHRVLNSHDCGVNESIILDPQQILQSARPKLIINMHEFYQQYLFICGLCDTLEFRSINHKDVCLLIGISI